MRSRHLWQHMDGTRGYYAKWIKSHWERQIPYDSTHKWNPKKKWVNKKQNENYKYRESTDGCQRGGRVGIEPNGWTGGNTGLQLWNEKSREWKAELKEYSDIVTAT